MINQGKSSECYLKISLSTKLQQITSVETKDVANHGRLLTDMDPPAHTTVPDELVEQTDQLYKQMMGPDESSSKFRMARAPMDDSLERPDGSDDENAVDGHSTMK